MAVVAVFEGPSFTRANYEESVKRVTGGKARVGSPADWPVAGLLCHIAGQGKNGFRVVDVWESVEAFRKFGETLVPILEVRSESRASRRCARRTRSCQPSNTQRAAVLLGLSPARFVDYQLHRSQSGRNFVRRTRP